MGGFTSLVVFGFLGFLSSFSFLSSAVDICSCFITAESFRILDYYSLGFGDSSRDGALALFYLHSVSYFEIALFFILKLLLTEVAYVILENFDDTVLSSLMSRD